MITRCPDCHAWFRVRADHLSVANGFVTCGDCNAVFNALPTLIEETAAVDRPPAAQPEAPAPVTAEPLTPDPDLSPVHQDVPPLTDSESDIAGAEAPQQALSADDHDILFTEPGTTDEADDTVPDYAAPPEEAPAVLRSDLAALSKLPLRSGSSRLIWRGLITGMCIAAAAQTAWLYRDDLTERFPHSEVVFAAACAYIPCTADADSDGGTIRLLARDVRDHPQYHEALLVNATMINAAISAKPFPVIALTLRDAVGNIMGARHFRPQEYLDESISIEDGMPPDQPIYVVMELGGGAAAAISFEFSFL